MVAFILAYALSPIDLIPDFIPVLGYLDDLVLIPLGLALLLRLLPPEVITSARTRAEAALSSDQPISRYGAILVVSTWLVLAALGFSVIRQAFW
ncbi:MAG: YkvA family protein [Chloroflexota bacterium]